MPSVTPVGLSSAGSAGALQQFQIQVSTDIDVTKLEFGMRGPVQPEIWIENVGGGVIEAAYRVDRGGRYTAYITYDGMDIPGSPYQVEVN